MVYGINKENDAKNTLYRALKFIRENPDNWTKEQLLQLESDIIAENWSSPLAKEFLGEIGISKTSSHHIYDKVSKYYPPDKYSNILLYEGDGTSSHLQRKLAKAGYSVALNGSISDRDVEPDLIIGLNVSREAKKIINSGKTSVFSLSINPEDYGFEFHGKVVNDINYFKMLIQRYHPDVKFKDGLLPEFTLFETFENRIKEEESPSDETLFELLTHLKGMERIYFPPYVISRISNLPDYEQKTAHRFVTSASRERGITDMGYKNLGDVEEDLGANVFRFVREGLTEIYNARIHPKENVATRGNTGVEKV